jgi:CubicO group peptidase (beta-lactamase class C family)
MNLAPFQMQPRRHEVTKKNWLSSCVRVFVVAFFGFVAPLAISPVQSQSVVPGKEWESIADPESAGYSSQRLAGLRAWLGSLDTTGMMVIVGGRSLFTYGDVAHLSYLASCRKSVLALLYGRYVEDGTIALDRTLSELQFTDVGGLLPREQTATVRHLLSARSGVYHPASNGGDDLAHAPPRGSQPPGARYLYNNWDFNAAGAIFERATGRDVYDALEHDLARPLGMQDFDRARQVKNGNLEQSQYPAYPIWLSTRDMARVGLLALRGGRWGDRQLVPADWIRRTATVVSPFADMDQAFADSPPTVGRWGYGYLWWVWDALDPSDPLTGAFTAWGVGGQYITVVPKLDMVVAHKTDTANRKAVSARQYDVALRMLIASKQ